MDQFNKTPELTQGKYLAMGKLGKVYERGIKWSQLYFLAALQLLFHFSAPGIKVASFMVPLRTANGLRMIEFGSVYLQ